MNIKFISKIGSFGTILLFLCIGCNNDYSKNPDCMLGYWKSLYGKPDLTIDKDSLEYYVIVHHKVMNGKECSIRYPLVFCDNSSYIKAQSRILLVYSKKNKTLFLSPGGEYYSSQPK